MNTPQLYYDACAALNITPEKIKEKCRKREIVQKRQVIAYLLVVNEKHLTLMDVAKLVGLNDHSSVIYAAFHASDDGWRDVIKIRKETEAKLRK